MRYQVIIQPPALADVEEACRWIAERSPHAAADWLEGLLAAAESLEANPERCGLAPENDYVDYEIRQFLYRRHSSVYRVLFTIHEGAVRILHVRHAARQFLLPEEFPPSL